MAPPIQKPKPSSPSLNSQSAAIFNSCIERFTRGKQLISRALDFDEELHADSRIDKVKLVDKAKAILKLYLDGGEIIKTILVQGMERLTRYLVCERLDNSNSL